MCKITGDVTEVVWGPLSLTCLLLRQVHESSGFQSTQFKTSGPFLGKASTLVPQEMCYWILTCKPISSHSLTATCSLTGSFPKPVLNELHG